MVAQPVIESGWGRSGLARVGKAWFGIKARATWRGKVYSGTTMEHEGGRWVRYPGTGQVYPSYSAALSAGCRPAGLFRAYDDPGESVQDHAAFFRQNSRYHGALARYAKTGDARQFAKGIHRAGYATDPSYSGNLVRFMEQFCRDLLDRC